MLNTLRQIDMNVNDKKSQTVPSKVLNHLSFQVDFETGHLKVPKEKVRF